MSLFDQLQEEQEQQKRQLQAMSKKGEIEQPKDTSTRKSTGKVTQVRDNPREVSSGNSRKIQRELPTRDEVQEFSFRLRDHLRVKVQAEVPHEWQDELEDIARKLDVKKLELYRFIIGEFLGWVRRKGENG